MERSVTLAALTCCLVAAGCTAENPQYLRQRPALPDDLSVLADLSTPTDLTVVPDLTTPDWLSDHAWTSGTSAWGPIEKDRSNGEQRPGDGKALTLRGVTYAKGLGVHANSEIRWALDRAYRGLVTDVGVDDETGGFGSVVFQIFVDGIKQYDSGVRRGGQDAVTATVNLTGAGDLRLVVGDAGDGNTADHADWAGARLLR